MKHFLHARLGKVKPALPFWQLQSIQNRLKREFFGWRPPVEPPKMFWWNDARVDAGIIETYIRAEVVTIRTSTRYLQGGRPERSGLLFLKLLVGRKDATITHDESDVHTHQSGEHVSVFEARRRIINHGCVARC